MIVDKLKSYNVLCPTFEEIPDLQIRCNNLFNKIYK